MKEKLKMMSIVSLFLIMGPLCMISEGESKGSEGAYEANWESLKKYSAWFKNSGFWVTVPTDFRSHQL